jgi:hypothetical protein
MSYMALWPCRRVRMLEDARRVLFARAHAVAALEHEHRLLVEAERVEHGSVVCLDAEVVDEVEHLVELQRAAVVHAENAQAESHCVECPANTFS